MILGQGLFGLIALALWVYCIFDVISTDQSKIQNLPKMVWLLIVVFVPAIGAIAWLLLGRPRGASFRPRSTEYRPDASPTQPEPPQGFPERPIPDADYQRRREEAIRRHQEEREEELKAREAELRRLEDELRRREQGPDEPDK
ncbi:MAG: PLD nuclease N-terminal domain-containing protein [Actinomycetota bacterium]